MIYVRYTSVIPVHTHFVIHQIIGNHILRINESAVKNFRAITMIKYIDFLNQDPDEVFFEKFSVLYVL